MMAFGIVILYELTGCGIHLYLGTDDLCNSNPPSQFNVFVRKFGYVCVRKYGPILMLFVYFCIYLKLKVQSKGLSAVVVSKKTETKLLKKFAGLMRRRETAFLLQCFFICAIYEVRYAAHKFSTLFASDGSLVDSADITEAGAVVKDIIARGRVKDIGVLQCDLPVQDGAEVDADVWMAPAWSVLIANDFPTLESTDLSAL
ncbi:hypothetical protein Ddc_16235 [Ditylenchus destructor]|nr:hypothetical protein Ddc_16235 [Ditylenchus destructor]